MAKSGYKISAQHRLNWTDATCELEKIFNTLKIANKTAEQNDVKLPVFTCYQLVATDHKRLTWAVEL